MREHGFYGDTLSRRSFHNFSPLGKCHRYEIFHNSLKIKISFPHLRISKHTNTARRQFAMMSVRRYLIPGWYLGSEGTGAEALGWTTARMLDDLGSMVNLCPLTNFPFMLN